MGTRLCSSVFFVVAVSGVDVSNAGEFLFGFAFAFPCLFGFSSAFSGVGVSHAVGFLFGFAFAFPCLFGFSSAFPCVDVSNAGFVFAISGVAVPNACKYLSPMPAESLRRKQAMLEYWRLAQMSGGVSGRRARLESWKLWQMSGGLSGNRTRQMSGGRPIDSIE